MKIYPLIFFNKFINVTTIQTFFKQLTVKNSIFINLQMQSSNNLQKQIKNYVYSTDSKVGKGFSSVVYKGTNINTNQHVAIKVIDLKSIKNDVQRMLLANQMKAVKIMEHQNTLKTYQICQTPNNIYIISQFCQVGDLANIIKNKGKHTQQQSLKIFQQIVKGLNHIHQKEILHRDIKSSNIFFKNNIAKIGDFGFSQFIKQNKGQTFYNVGSPLYMSPQAYRKTKYSIKSDCWALGIILFQLLIGQQPFQGIDYDNMLKKISSGEIYHNLNVNGFVKMLLSRMLSIDIERRIQTVQILKLLKSNQPKIISQVSLIRPLSRIQLNEHVTSNIPPNLIKKAKHNFQLVDFKQNNPISTGFERKLPPKCPNIHQENKSIIHTTYQNKKTQNSKVNVAEKLKLAEFMLSLCNSLLQFKDKNNNFKRVFLLSVRQFKSLVQFLSIYIKNSTDLQLQTRYNNIERRLEDFNILSNFNQIQNDQFFEFLIKNIKPENQTYYLYSQFWLKNALNNFYQFIKTNQINQNSYEIQQAYLCYIYMLRYYQILEVAKVVQYSSMIPQNAVIQRLLNERQNLCVKKFERLEQIKNSIVKI